MFRGWADWMSPTLEVCAVQLPGRETRLDEERYTNMPCLIEDLADALSPFLQEPFVLFGHSLGGLIAFELARRLRERGQREPSQLIVSAHRAPHLPSRIGPFSHLSDAEFVEAMRNLGTTPAEVLDDAELRAIVLPTLRSDFAVSESYAFRVEPPLDCPIVVLGGLEDPLVCHDELVAWCTHSRRPAAIRMLPGDHFFVETARAAVLRAIRRELIPGRFPAIAGRDGAEKSTSSTSL